MAFFLKILKRYESSFMEVLYLFFRAILASSLSVKVLTKRRFFSFSVTSRMDVRIFPTVSWFCFDVTSWASGTIHWSASSFCCSKSITLRT